MAEESSMGFGPSFQLGVSDKGGAGNDAGLPDGSISMSN